MKLLRLSTGLLVVALVACCTSAEAADIQRKQLLNDQWQFVLNDSDFTKSQAVTLPHDWSIHQRFDRNAVTGGEGAYLPAGKGWYRI